MPPQVEPVSKKNNLNESLLDIGIFGGNKKSFQARWILD